MPPGVNAVTISPGSALMPPEANAGEREPFPRTEKDPEHSGCTAPVDAILLSSLELPQTSGNLCTSTLGPSATELARESSSPSLVLKPELPTLLSENEKEELQIIKVGPLLGLTRSLHKIPLSCFRNPFFALSFSSNCRKKQSSISLNDSTSSRSSLL
nr:hypothetical protein Iba_chr08bCG6970 [Ipomoea batatas]